MPIEKIFTTALRNKHNWAMCVPDTYQFFLVCWTRWWAPLGIALELHWNVGNGERRSPSRQWDPCLSCYSYSHCNGQGKWKCSESAYYAVGHWRVSAKGVWRSDHRSGHHRRVEMSIRCHVAIPSRLISIRRRKMCLMSLYPSTGLVMDAEASCFPLPRPFFRLLHRRRAGSLSSLESLSTSRKSERDQIRSSYREFLKSGFRRTVSSLSFSLSDYCGGNEWVL